MSTALTRYIHRSSLTPADCWTSATGSRSIGKSAETPQASLLSSCTVGLVAASNPPSGGCSTRHAIASCCSISAAAAGADRTPVSPTPISAPIPPGTLSPTSSGCASTGASTAGRCSGALGAVRSHWRTPKITPTASPSSCYVASSHSVGASWAAVSGALRDVPGPAGWSLLHR